MLKSILYFLTVLHVSDQNFQIVSSVNETWKSCGLCQCYPSQEPSEADCTSQTIQITLNQIPKHLGPRLKTINLSGQIIHELPPRAFFDSDLQVLNKIQLDHCQLRAVQEDAFIDLVELLFIDISWNEITELQNETFSTNTAVEIIRLNNNRLHEITDGLFANLTHLKEVSLYGNKLEYVGKNAFVNNFELVEVNLQDNKLISFDVSILELTSVSFLLLNNNPWMCDCESYKFFELLISRNVSYGEVICANPSSVYGMQPVNLNATNFQCPARILSLQKIEENLNQIKIACHVSGSPKPNITWSFDDKTTSPNVQILQISDVHADYSTASKFWSNITVTHEAEEAHISWYKCRAENMAGVDSKKIEKVAVQQSGVRLWMSVAIGVVGVFLIGIIVGIILQKRKKLRYRSLNKTEMKNMTHTHSRNLVYEY